MATAATQPGSRRSSSPSVSVGAGHVREEDLQPGGVEPRLVLVQHHPDVARRRQHALHHAGPLAPLARRLGRPAGREYNERRRCAPRGPARPTRAACAILRAMIVELAILRAKPGAADADAGGAAGRACRHRPAEGYRGSTFHQGIEDPQRFVLRIEWDTVEAHTEGFRGGPLFPQWRSHWARVHGRDAGRAALPGVRWPLGGGAKPSDLASLEAPPAGTGAFRGRACTPGLPFRSESRSRALWQKQRRGHTFRSSSSVAATAFGRAMGERQRSQIQGVVAVALTGVLASRASARTTCGRRTRPTSRPPRGCTPGTWPSWRRWRRGRRCPSRCCSGSTVTRRDRRARRSSRRRRPRLSPTKDPVRAPAGERPGGRGQWPGGRLHERRQPRGGRRGRRPHRGLHPPGDRRAVPRGRHGRGVRWRAGAGQSLPGPELRPDPAGLRRGRQRGTG